MCLIGNAPVFSLDLATLPLAVRLGPLAMSEVFSSFLCEVLFPYGGFSLRAPLFTSTECSRFRLFLPRKGVFVHPYLPNSAGLTALPAQIAIPPSQSDPFRSFLFGPRRPPIKRHLSLFFPRELLFSLLPGRGIFSPSAATQNVSSQFGARSAVQPPLIKYRSSSPPPDPVGFFFLSRKECSFLLAAAATPPLANLVRL